MQPAVLYLTITVYACSIHWVDVRSTHETITLTVSTNNTENASSATVTQRSGRCKDLPLENRTRCIADLSQISTHGPNTTTTINTSCNETDKTGGCEEEPVVHPYQSTVKTVITYVGYITVPLFMVMSLTGNCLTVIVMLSKKFWNSPCSLLLIALALSDSTYSIVFPFSKLFVRELIGYDPRALTEVGCHIFFIVHKASKMCSSWFIVAICVERFIAVWFPLQANIICCRRNTIIVVLSITIGMLMFTGFWTFSTMIVNGICVPNYATPETAVPARAYLVAGSLVFSVIPATILIILTPTICARLHHQTKMRRRLSTKAKENSETARANAMLLGVTIAYIILVTPTAIAHNVTFSLNIDFYENKWISMTIARAVLQFLEQLNFSINFFMYVVCNRSFRNRVLIVLCCNRMSNNGAKTESKVTNQTELSKW